MTDKFETGGPTDTEMLDWMDKQTGSYTGRVIWRRSNSGRGWRLHETDIVGALPSVREAIKKAMLEAERAKRMKGE